MSSATLERRPVASDSRRPRLSLSFLGVTRLVAIAVAALIVLPLVITIWRLVVDERSLTPGTFVDTWNEPGTIAMLRNTIVMVGGSTALAVAIAATFAWLNERTDARIGWASETLPIVPFFVPPLAGAIGWVILAEPNVGLLNTAIRSLSHRIGIDLGSSGPIDIYSWYGLIFVTTLYLVPHAYLVIGSALQNLDPSLEEASRMSGAGHLRTLLRVTLPAIRPSLISAVLLALVVGFALYSVPVLIAAGANIDILSVRIVRLMTKSFPPEMAQAVVLCLIMVVFIGTASFLQTRATRAGRHATIGGRFGGGAIIKLGILRWPARAAVIGYLLASSVLPFIGLVLLSLQKFWSTDIAWSKLSLDNYTNLFLSGTEFGDATKALRNSIVLGLVGATAAILIAALITYYIAARSQGVLGRAVNSIVKLPGALSHIVLALALIATLAGPPISLGGTLTILFIAYLVMYMPQASVTAGSAYFQVDRFLQEASRISGASDFRTFRRVTLPLMAPGLASGWVFVFILMVGDLTGSVMLASTNTPVLGTVLLDTFGSGSYTDVAALSVVATLVPGLIAIVVLLGTRRLFRIRGRES